MFYNNNYKQLDDWGVIAGCEECLAVFDVRYCDLEVHHDPRRADTLFASGGAYDYPPMKSVEMLMNFLDKREAQRQRYRDTAFSTPCANCAGRVYIELAAIPKYVQNHLLYYGLPQMKQGE